MSDPKFTNGPWEVLDLRSEGCERLSISGPNVIICRIASEISGRLICDEDVANADLIAAAPELYALLERAVNEYDARWSMGSNWADAAIAALRKARGERCAG